MRCVVCPVLYEGGLWRVKLTLHSTIHALLSPKHITSNIKYNQLIINSVLMLVNWIISHKWTRSLMPCCLCSKWIINVSQKRAKQTQHYIPSKLQLPKLGLDSDSIYEDLMSSQMVVFIYLPSIFLSFRQSA